MSWQIEVFDEFERGTMDRIIDSAVGYLPECPTIEQIDKAVARAIDERCVHYTTMLAVIQHCGMTGEAFDLAYETFYEMVWDRVAIEVEED